MLIDLTSYPRSGNSLVADVITVALSQTWIEKATGKEWLVKTVYITDLSPGATFAEGEDLAEEEMANSDSVVYIRKSHNPPDEKVHKTIYVLRDGRDCIVSYAAMQSDFDKSVDWLGLLARGEFCTPWGDWPNHVEAWLPKADVILRYEELVKDSAGEVIKAIDKLGFTATQIAQVVDFKKLHDECPHYPLQFYRRGIVGSHKDELPEDLLEVFMSRAGKTLQSLGYI